MNKPDLRCRSLLANLHSQFYSGICKFSVPYRSSSLSRFPGCSTGMLNVSIRTGYPTLRYNQCKNSSELLIELWLYKTLQTNSIEPSAPRISLAANAQCLAGFQKFLQLSRTLEDLRGKKQHFCQNVLVLSSLPVWFFFSISKKHQGSISNQNQFRCLCQATWGIKTLLTVVFLKVSSPSTFP